ncbi:hypothetical protein E2G82_27180 [Salmonella enterica subsp. enterica serovar Ramatgan]|nr:hypothetical protein [Salmonella enterica subsp. enterica serovar Ramatgan]EDE5106126.1 hypothetical protein [Salmonella enterica subsp. enterica serovar Newport]
MAKAREVKTSSVRECRFYIRYIANNFQMLNKENIISNFSDTEICCRIINQHIRHVFSHDKDIEECILNLETQFLKNTIPDDNFLWLKEDKRATFWVWGQLALKGYMNDEINRVLNTSPETFWYKEAKAILSPVNHEQRYNAIIDVIDYICSISSSHCTEMTVWINNKLLGWRHAQKTLVKVPWLSPEDEKECYEAYNYIKKRQEEYKETEDDDFFPVKIPEPLNAEEAYLSFYALHDLWNSTPERSHEINKTMLATRGQRVRRQKIAEKKRMESLSEEGKEKLKFLAKHYNCSETSLLDMLISDRYRGISMSVNNKTPQ